MQASGLRDYQLATKAKIFEAWKLHPNVMVQMPTGTGKTHLLAAVVHDVLEAGGGRGCVWIVAHRRELVEQIEETVARYGLEKTDGRVRACSIQWLARHWEDTREKPVLIVIDEAHHALAETYRELWKRYPDTPKLGMTATPCRLNGRGFTDLFDRLVASDSIADFIRKGWLSVFDYISIRPESEDQRLIDGLAKRGADGDYQMKEMDAVLNRRPGIGRLYEGMRRYAAGKKGIVYAVSIGHARNIAAYYSAQGVRAEAIDSHTPAPLRKRLVEEFRAGRIRVLVNVDVFSEGFDCPDVEFVQMARPTLSLAKYLQQAGRGLRKAEGKETCVLIDHVGLYRMFGLPVAERDWQATFEGRLAGKGIVTSGTRTAACTVTERRRETEESNEPLEVVMSHERLLDCLRNGLPCGPDGGRVEDELKPFRDRKSGLWGLKRGRLLTVKARYARVFDVRDDLAAVRFGDWSTGIVDGNGTVRRKTGRCTRVRLLPDGLAELTDGRETDYMDLRTGSRYAERPTVVKYGRMELLRVGDAYCSRTKHVYRSRPGMSEYDIADCGFYLKIYRTIDFRPWECIGTSLNQDCVCLLADDGEEYYWFCGELADGSIVTADGEGRYYRVTADGKRQYMARENPGQGEEDFHTALSRLQAEVELLAEKRKEKERLEQEKRRKERLEGLRQAVPFRSGLKWGLKVGERVVVPPVYRSIRMPVGNYCAVEGHAHQWGIIMLDGRVVVETRYLNVEIRENGTADLTLIPGKTRTVKL